MIFLLLLKKIKAWAVKLITYFLIISRHLIARHNFNEANTPKLFVSKNNLLFIVCKGPSLKDIIYPKYDYDVMMPNTLPFTSETRSYFPPKVDYWIRNRSADLLPIKFLVTIKYIISPLKFSLNQGHQHSFILWLLGKKILFPNFIGEKTLLYDQNTSPTAKTYSYFPLSTGIYAIYLAVKFSYYKEIHIYGLDLFENGISIYPYSAKSLQKNLKYLIKENYYSGPELIYNRDSDHDSEKSIRFLAECFSKSDKIIHITTRNKRLLDLASSRVTINIIT